MRSRQCYLVGLAYFLVTDGQFCDERFLFCSGQCSASIEIGKGVLWDGQRRKRFLSPHLSFPRLTFYSTRHRDIHQIWWSDDSDLRHCSRWTCKSSKCGGTSRQEIQKTFVRVCLCTACRCLLRRQVLVNLVPKCRPDSSMFKPMQVCILQILLDIRTSWKFSSRRRKPLLMMPLSRFCLFQCNKIIWSSAFNMQ